MNDIAKVLIASLFGASGPIASWLLAKGVPADQISPLMQALQPFIVTATPILSAWFIAHLHTAKAKIAAIAGMSPAAAAMAVENLSPDAQAAIKIAATSPQ